MDYYENINDYCSAFKQLANQSKKIIHSDNDIFKKITCKDKQIMWKKDEMKSIKISIPGMHNKENAINAKKAAIEIGVLEKEIESSLENFKGTWRRMEKKRQNLIIQFIT